MYTYLLLSDMWFDEGYISRSMNIPILVYQVARINVGMGQG